jgi:uncharacterized protein (TIGR03435 family)
MREARSVAAAVLAARGVSLDVLREAVAARVSGEQQEFQAPPPTAANTYQWPQIPFVASRTVHILHSGLQPPSPPAINHPGPVFSAYGFTLEEIIVRAWEGNRWHIEIPLGLRENARFDFLMVLPQPETAAACLGLLRPAIEQQFGVHVTRETRLRDVYRLTNIPSGSQMLRRYPNPPDGTGFSMLSFSTFMGRSPGTPMFPLDGFAVHSVPFFLLVHWFEEILGGQIVDETRLPGIYGFELKKKVDTSEAFIELLRDQAGLVIRRERREVPTLIVRQTGVS